MQQADEHAPTQMTGSADALTGRSLNELNDRGANQPPGAALPVPQSPKEIGGREGPEPTRFGDWEKSGRCIDF